MVTREAVQYDSASDWLTVASRVGIVCQGSASWVSTWARRCVTAQGRPNVSTIPLDDMKAARALSETVVRVHFFLLTESAVQRMSDFAAQSPFRPQLYISDRSEADIEVGCH